MKNVPNASLSAQRRPWLVYDQWYMFCQTEAFTVYRSAADPQKNTHALAHKGVLLTFKIWRKVFSLSLLTPFRISLNGKWRKRFLVPTYIVTSSEPSVFRLSLHAELTVHVQSVQHGGAVCVCSSWFFLFFVQMTCSTFMSTLIELRLLYSSLSGFNYFI